MRKKSLLTALLFAAAFEISTVANAITADYNIVPLPKSVTELDTTRTFALQDGDIISYPTGNEELKRNAAFLKDYLLETCGLRLTTEPDAKKAAVVIALRNEKKRTDNPDSYTITVSKKGIAIQANCGEGIFRAVQTLRKSTISDASEEAGKPALFPYATINDEPRFQYRGQHLDVARHYMPTDFIKRFIDICALHGINQFHWHITDDQGWRFEIKSMPELAKKGSFRPHTVIGNNCYSGNGTYLYDDTPEEGYYTQEEIKDIINYAQQRYINIIPEIDLPGHMVAALHVYPELGCTGGPYDVWPVWGVADDVLCAGNPKVMDFLKKVLGETCDVFPSKMIHIGGDESPRVRWEKCPKCQAKMKELGLKKEAQLQTYINKEMDKFLQERGRTLIGWDETLEGGLSENAIVMSWRGYNGGIAAARQHHPVIMTPTDHCYIDYYQLKNQRAQPLAIGGYVPVSKVYSMEPVPTELTEEEQKYILGPQCNLWTEYVLSPEHAEYMLLPRMAAMSEVQWMQPDKKNYEEFTKRLNRLQQLYKKLGYNYCQKYE